MGRQSKLNINISNNIVCQEIPIPFWRPATEAENIFTILLSLSLLVSLAFQQNLETVCGPPELAATRPPINEGATANWVGRPVDIGNCHQICRLELAANLRPLWLDDGH